MSPNEEGRNKGQCEKYVWQYYLKYNNNTYLLLLLLVPSPSMNYLSSMPLVGSQLCSWQMMTCQQMTGIMDYVRITCEKGIQLVSSLSCWWLRIWCSSVDVVASIGQQGVIPATLVLLLLLLPPPWSPTLYFFSPPPPFPPDLPPPPPVVPLIPPSTHKQHSRSRTPRSTESNLHPSCASRQKERNKYRWSYHQHMMNLDQ